MGGRGQAAHPPGDYVARCTGFQGPQWVRAFGRWGLRLDFVLDPEEQAVSAFYSLGENRNAFKFGTRSKYYKDWVRANGGPPKRGQEMSPGGACESRNRVYRSCGRCGEGQ